MCPLFYTYTVKVGIEEMEVVVSNTEQEKFERLREEQIKIMDKRNKEQQRKAEEKLLNAQIKEVWEE